MVTYHCSRNLSDGEFQLTEPWSAKILKYLLKKTKNANTPFPKSSSRKHSLSTGFHHLRLQPTVTRCKVLQFADGIALANELKTTKGATNGLLHGIDQLNESCSKWRIKLNTGKTQAILFIWKNESITLPIEFGDSTLEQTTEIKFLGLTLQMRLQWTRHIEGTNKKMKAKVA